MVSQPGISGDMALLSPASMLICIGHSPVKPLAASPLMGSAAQSNRRSNVRRNFMAGIIAEPFYLCPGEFVTSDGSVTNQDATVVQSRQNPRTGRTPASGPNGAGQERQRRVVSILVPCRTSRLRGTASSNECDSATGSLIAPT